ncbi:MAG: FtsQ-type POTRA domain-containing protein [Lacisediminihabitans sp.]
MHKGAGQRDARQKERKGRKPEPKKSVSGSPAASTPAPPAVRKQVATEAKSSKKSLSNAGAVGEAKSQVRKAARERKRYERGEVRRFTRRSRNRRAAWLAVLGVFVVLFCLVAVAVYSPALALKTVRIDGASRVSAAEIKDAVKDQVGTPLALLDFQRIKVELAKFPLIRSYVTEAVPPNTLIIHIVERAPIGAMADSTGFVVVDPAGVTISHTAERPPAIPVIDTGSSDTRSAAFTSAVSVLLALPSSVLSKVDTVTATTKDDVTLVLSGVGQKVVWGSADRSAMKARVLADLISHQDPNSVVEFDVSAPSNAVVRPG